jgi:hypothetical protein
MRDLRGYIVEALLWGEWVEVWRGTHEGEQQRQYEMVAARRGYENVRMVGVQEEVDHA